MRDEGKSWVAIGAALGLPGAKSGAGAARKLYAQHWGSYSGTQAVRARKAAPPAASAKASPRYERVEKVVSGEDLFASMTDNEVMAYVCGKTVVWLIDLRRLAHGKGEPGYSEMEARVHPTDAIIEPGAAGPDERCLRFREYWGNDDRGKPISGPTRTVRLSAIHTVR
jgi:hypothetical protein